MCGIIFVHGKTSEQAKALARHQFKSQITRGQQGFGIVEVRRNVTRPRIRRALYTKPALEELDKVRSEGVMFHHRIPTSTTNTIQATHPFRVTQAGRKIFLIHNGVITNEDDILKKLNITPEKLRSYSEKTDAKGKVTYTYNDSEALACDFLDALITGRKELYAEGSAAIIAYEPALNGVWLYRNDGNPLKVSQGGGVFMAASETPACENIKPGNLYFYSLAKRKMEFIRKLHSEAWSGKWYGSTTADKSLEQDYGYGSGYSQHGGGGGMYGETEYDWRPPAHEGRIGATATDIQSIGINGNTKFKGRELASTVRFTGVTDISNRDKSKRFLNGYMVSPTSKLHHILEDEDNLHALEDEMSSGELHVADITDVDEFFTLIERIRSITPILDELYTSNPAGEFWACDEDTHKFMLERLRQLMWIYCACKQVFSHVCRKEPWIQEAITEAQGALIASAEVEDKMNGWYKDKPPTPPKQATLIGFRTGKDTVTSNQPK